MVALTVAADPCFSLFDCSAPDIEVEAREGWSLDSGPRAVDTGRYRDGKPTLLRSDGAIDGVYSGFPG